VKKVKKNIKYIQLILFTLLNLFIFSNFSYSQAISISTSKSIITLQETFSVQILFSKDNKREFKAFRKFIFLDIADFEKGRTEFLDKNEDKEYKIIQYYKPRKPGIFTINPIKIKIRDELYTTNTTKIIVSKANQQSDIKEIENEIDSKEPLQYEEPKLDILFNISSSKISAYLGEGFGISFSLLIATTNKAEITFINLNDQRKELIKKITSLKCLVDESPLNNESNIDTIYLSEKQYTRWKIYEAIVYPIDSIPVKIPSLPFTLLTYAIATNGNESIERKTISKTFLSKPITIKIKPLPFNIDIKQIPVGVFSLSERISSSKTYTGKSFKYYFTITGEGNIANLPSPIIQQSIYFDFYTPKIKQESKNVEGRKYGTKSFEFYVTPKEPETFNLSKYIIWPYFNTRTGKIDTLRSSIILNVRGESLKNNYISTNNSDHFYSKIDTEDNSLHLLIQEDKLKFWVNIVILAMLVITGIIVFKK